MKHTCIFFLTLIIISLTVIGILSPKRSVPTDEYLRIHIRAHSNAQCDQAIKYEVRDEIVAALTPIVASCDTREQAVERMKNQTKYISRVADRYMQSKGFTYGVKAKLCVENFPDRVYEGYVLPRGEYLSLIVELGEGKGDNWWCVVYPPLCFTAQNTPIVYRSKILEMIKNFKKG